MTSIQFAQNIAIVFAFAFAAKHIIAAFVCRFDFGLGHALGYLGGFPIAIIGGFSYLGANVAAVYLVACGIALYILFYLIFDIIPQHTEA